VCLWTPRMRRQPGQRRRSLTVFLAALKCLRHPSPRWHGGSATANLNKTGVRLWTARSMWKGVAQTCIDGHRWSRSPLS
jgi:hypothetical protein